MKNKLYLTALAIIIAISCTGIVEATSYPVEILNSASSKVYVNITYQKNGHNHDEGTGTVLAPNAVTTLNYDDTPISISASYNTISTTSVGAINSSNNIITFNLSSSINSQASKGLTFTIMGDLQSNLFIAQTYPYSTAFKGPILRNTLSNITHINGYSDSTCNPQSFIPQNSVTMNPSQTTTLQPYPYYNIFNENAELKPLCTYLNSSQTYTISVNSTKQITAQ